MKHNRIVALVASALLVLGTATVVTPKVFAQSASQQNNANEVADNGNERETSGMDGDMEQKGNQNGWDQREIGDRHDPIPQGKPSITPAAAIASAQSYLKTAELVVGKLQLEDENGQLVYSIWIGGADVKVDAMTGKVLGTDGGSD